MLSQDVPIDDIGGGGGGGGGGNHFPCRGIRYRSKDNLQLSCSFGLDSEALPVLHNRGSKQSKSRHLDTEGM